MYPHSFLLLKNVPLYRYTTLHLFMVDMHLGCFYFLVLMENYSSMNICVQIFAWTHVFISLGYMFRGEFSRPYGNSIF